jgi:hypothetical protein
MKYVMETTLQTPVLDGALVIKKPASDESQVVKTQPIIINSCLNDAFMLGWKIVELRSRIEIGLSELNDEGLQFASIWRALLSRISMLQLKAFPSNSTASTLYDPPPKEVLPYLYPNEPDYANIGISQNNPNGEQILANFNLYDVTRRAINCLTLLYTRKEESLIPDLIGKYQVHLVQQILKGAEDPGAGGGQQPKGVGDQINGPIAEDPNFSSNLVKARGVLTERTLKFLTAWEGFLTENYYTSGSIPNDESELLAYEAGRSMSWLSWGISVNTVKLNEAAKSGDQTINTQSYINMWKGVFNTNAVMNVQHQISALSSTLDVAYLKGKGEVSSIKNQNDVVKDINLPSNAIQAVKSSVEYWYRTVSWLSDKKNEEDLKTSASANWSSNMQLAMIQQSDIWQTLMTGQQRLDAFNMESVTHKIMTDVIEKVQVSLQSNFKQTINQTRVAVQEAADKLKEIASQTTATALSGLQEVFKTWKRILIPIVGIVVFLVVGLIILVLNNKLTPTVISSSGAGTGLVSIILGYFGLDRATRVKDKQTSKINENQSSLTEKVDSGVLKPLDNTSQQNASGNLLNQIQGAAEDSGKMLFAAFERGYDQIKLELADINRSAAHIL